MSPQAGYLLIDQVLPRLRSSIPTAVPFISPETADDLLQDGLTIASMMIDGAERNGKRVVKSPSKVNGKYRKQPKEVTCGNICYYTIEKLRCGRRSTGSSCSDVHASMTQLHGRSKLTSLDDVAGCDDQDGEDTLTLHDVLSSNDVCPASRALRRVDWTAFLAGLSKRDVAIIDCLAEGKPLASLARRRHLNSSTLRYHRERLALKIQEYMGPDIIIEIQRRPQWKDSLDATRARQAVRYDRSH